MNLQTLSWRVAPAALIALAPLLPACGGGDEGTGSGASGSGGGPTVASRDYDTDIPLVEYAWDPQAGDPSVSAEDGGPGFTGEGWTTNLRFPALGTPEAKKGGTMVMNIPDWPATLRQEGKDWNTAFNYRARDLCFEGLLTVHPNTLEFIPSLATHWKISEDRSTYTYRINPKARWSDGKEVTAEDVVASYRLRMDERILFPSSQLVFGKLHEPVAKSKYIVEVRDKDKNWRNFLYFSGTAVLPAHQISIPGDEYLREFQNKYTAVTGPYNLSEDDVVMNQSLTLRLRDDYWDAGNPAWMGLWNFETYKFIVIADPILAFEKFKKGELDYYVIPKAQWWAEELPKVDAVKRGLIQRAKFYNDAPKGMTGLALNTTRPPLDDLKIRLALVHLRDRETYIDQLFFNEYAPHTSYWQGGTYQNPDNELKEFDPQRAVDLLEEAGWTETDSEGYRVKDGARLEFGLSYRSKLSEPSLTVYQEDCKKAGIKINMKLLDPAAFWKNLRQREYDISSMAWGGLVFPNPETSWSSKLAVVKDNNNVTAFANARVDELLDEYDLEFDVNRRAEIIREIDGIVFNEHPYVLDWYNPAERVVYWNKYALPNWGVWRTVDREELMYCWWFDSEKAALLERAQDDPSLTVPTRPMEDRFWKAWHEAQAGPQ